MTALVVDASAGVEWLLLSESGRRVELAVAGYALWVPEHYYVETAATIRRLQIANEITAERASVALSRLLVAPLRRVQIRPLLSEAWTLRDNITIADALYVVMARHLNAPLITLDAKLGASPTIDVPIIIP